MTAQDGEAGAAAAAPETEAVLNVGSADDGQVVRAWLAHCQDLRAQIAKLTEEYDHGVAAIKAAMGERTQAAVDGRVVCTWTWSKPATRIDRRQLEARYPQAAAECTVTNAPARQFRWAS